jgi:hypothetical protein
VTLAQKIVASSIFSVTEILTIEDQKLHNTFFHVAFGLQSLLKLTGDQTDSDTNWKIGEGDQMGGGWMGVNQNFSQELDICPKSNLTLLSSNTTRTT